MSFAPVSFKAADSISAYRIVNISAAGTVALADTTTDGIIGVTVDEATAANQAVPVAVSGVAKVYCNETMAAGALVTTNATGMAVPATGSTTGTAVLGRVLDAVSATGTIARVLIQPFTLFDVP